MLPEYLEYQPMTSADCLHYLEGGADLGSRCTVPDLALLTVEASSAFGGVCGLRDLNAEHVYSPLQPGCRLICT